MACYFARFEQMYFLIEIVETLECGAHLTEMSTTECHRIEAYEIRSCKSDSPSCKKVAQQDLTQLISLCNQPAVNFMCSMNSFQKKETDLNKDGSVTAKVCQVTAI
jgi:hypothetical protein